MGIKLILQPLGTAPDAIKGFVLKSKRIIAITVNCDIPLIMQKIIAAHELGHAVLHKSSQMLAFHEAALFDVSSSLERDANLFAAEYLLEDDRVLEALKSGNSFFPAAAALCVPMELLDFKLRVMRWKGYKLAEPPISARSNFLRDWEDDNGEDRG
ncbi:ImmA/IrrE family metallo-endopeptidase [bacterium]|nr:ImmA/IrrE family metallo-endopeptidase [bacterium]